MARWRSLHEDLHAATQALDELAQELHVATQVPAQLVGLAVACERRWKLGWRGHDKILKEFKIDRQRRSSWLCYKVW